MEDKELQGLVDHIQNNLTLDEGVAALKARDAAIRIDERKKVDYVLEVAQDILNDDPHFVQEFKEGFRVARKELQEDTKDRIAELRRESDQESKHD